MTIGDIEHVPVQESRDAVRGHSLTGGEKVMSVVVALTHSTAPWYLAIPIVVVALGARFWRSRRGGGRGPFQKGPFGGLFASSN